ncbi:M1 family metallopeptidase [Hymenobacter sp. BT770]|uniref:M1 family metallopeptidase n=1 Tax=Hymenobacter sp. BT770 TaxID=2886942 RepID=UPI001D112A7E|nr:M1 family metallopeptidase [Hymenobacter sp. BT770]MCC3154920.1 M1 family metallopeptidase [Hymenobacter sp. BT770]MDO3417330.1 M1 family metallopeptidase [Hymenobacter sp. BT770]
MKFLPLSLLLGLLAGYAPRAAAQLLQPAPAAFTRADSLRGGQSPLRTCYDINYYHLDVKLDPAQRYLSGSNLFRFTATREFNRLQFDLFANLKVEKVLYKGKEMPFTREANAVFVTFPKAIAAGSRDEFTVYYSGNPTVAKKAPWDGGLVFAQDAAGQPWVASACQGVGASIWWPTKDQQADEVDSMLISVTVPKGLKDVSNGRLRKITKLKGGFTRFDWAVRNPINNYDVALNVGNYQRFGDVYQGEKGPLTLDYWVLPENLIKAKMQFDANVKPMLKSMEHWFGPYPFYQDGYKLVDAPHLGMEHQSAVAYGNKYLNGYLGRDRSNTGWGLKWDFIIIHESGHEWFGNNITTKDIADMWVHESFTTYSEALFVESQFGKPAGQEYIHGQRRNIQNDGPIIGPYGVNKEGSGDMYDKGSNLLNALRTIVNDDEKWRQMLRGLSSTFYHQTVTGQQVIDYFNRESGKDLSKIFDQYLRHASLPTLEVRFENNQTLARWVSEVPKFDMPVRMRLKGGEYQFVPLTTKFEVIKQLPGAAKDNLEVDTFNYYIGVLVE